MSGRLKKAVWLLMAAVLLAASSFIQRSLNRDRERLGLTRVAPLENAPPVLAFTTVALGGFRGLIANALWLRATDLQDEDKFFEMAQLADWITKLEPHFVQVWMFQAWNMAYNISVKFKDADDRWRWVKRGIELLRDEGLRYNPNEVLLYQQLGILFQHKMGANLDDANMYYKREWGNEMADVLGRPKPNLDELLNPQTPDARARLELLTNKYKMDPSFMKKVDEQYGPLEWRLPESHAIYWASVGLQKARENPTKVSKEDLITLRRVIYQSMQMAFLRGKLVANPFQKVFEFGPNLDIASQVSAAYEQAMQEDAQSRDGIARAHRNFLRDAVYLLYTGNRTTDAARWYRFIVEKYPDRPLITGNTNSLPGRLTLEQYVVARVQEDVGETDRNRIQAIIEGLIDTALHNLVLGEDDRAAGLRLLAQKIWVTYQSNIKGSEQRIGLQSVEEIEKERVSALLDPESGVPLEIRSLLHAKLGLPAEIAPVPGPTNAPSTTNAPSGATGNL